MFGTVIIDAYRKDEAMEMANAIDDLCSPNDTYGWASAGIYCFWDYYSGYPSLLSNVSILLFMSRERLCLKNFRLLQKILFF